MAKVDVKSAYRNSPPGRTVDDGHDCEGALYIDTCLPFGLRSAPKILQQLLMQLCGLYDKGQAA